MDLFNASKYIKLDLEDASILYYPKFYDLNQATKLYNAILKDTPWQQDKIKVYGKTYNQPRLTAFYSNTKNVLEYSNIKMKPHTFTKCLIFIKNEIEKEINIAFNSCLINLYRDGNDSNGWHSDNEKQLGNNPIIASLSLGAERYFHLKHRIKQLKQKLLLEQGSLLIMEGETQHNWLHQIPKTKKKIGKRINITFRSIK